MAARRTQDGSGMMAEAFRRFKKDVWGGFERELIDSLDPMERQRDLAKLLRASTGYTLADISAFADTLKFDHEEGMFLTALIQEGPPGVLVMPGSSGMHGLGTGLDRRDVTVIVMGDVGDYLAHRMRAGRIMIKGDAGHGAGDFMESGEVRVMGGILSLGEAKGGRIIQGDEVVFEARPPKTAIREFLERMARDPEYREKAEELLKRTTS